MIDIIIPVYNTPEEDLKRCLDSILSSTFKDYKVYIIDDGSKDATKEYLDEYVKDKDNFIVKHIPNGGVSNARNLGIDISDSKYLTFVDSDDYIEKDFLKEAYDLIENNNLDLIIGGYNEVRNNEIIKTRLCLPGLHIYEKDSIIYFFDKLLSGKITDINKEIGNAPTGRIYTRLYRRSSLEDLRFNTNIHMSEDTLFMIDLTLKLNRIGLVDKVWYNYLINDYSISNGTKKDKLIHNIEDFIKEIELRKDKENNIRIKEAYQSRIDKANNEIINLKKDL